MTEIHTGCEGAAWVCVMQEKRLGMREHIGICIGNMEEE